MPANTPEDEALLSELLAGELEVESEAGQAALSANGLTVEDFEAMQEVVLALDSPAIIDESMSSPNAPGVDDVKAIVEGLSGAARDAASSDHEARREPPWKWVVVAGVAAAFLGVIVLVNRRDSVPESGRQDYALGGDQNAGLQGSKSGRTDDQRLVLGEAGQLRAPFNLAPGDRVEVEIQGSKSPGKWVLLVDFSSGDSPISLPEGSSEELRRWPTLRARFSHDQADGSQLQYSWQPLLVEVSPK